MGPVFTRRAVVAGGASALALANSASAQAQAAPKLKFSCAFPETDLRAKAYKAFAAAMKDDIEIEPYWGNTLFKQGAELVALQRDNLDLCNLAPADIAKQIPAWSLMTSAYLFRDYAHLNKTFKSDVGKEFIKMARDQLGVEVIRPVYFGARQVNLKPDKKITTPADMAGIKLRMPPGEYLAVPRQIDRRQSDPGRFRRALHRVADRHCRRARQSAGHGQVDEVRRSHDAIRPDQPRHRLRHADGLEEDLGKPEAAQQAKFRAEADKAFDASAAEYDAQEAEAIEYFKKEGKKVYEPDQNAFRAFAQKSYLDKYGNDWPKGAIESDQRGQISTDAIPLITTVSSKLGRLSRTAGHFA